MNSKKKVTKKRVAKKKVANDVDLIKGNCLEELDRLHKEKGE